MGSENELLRLCSRVSMEAVNVERLKDILKGQLDWGYIQRFSRRNRVFALVYRTLAQYSPDQLPAEVSSDFKMLCLQNGVRNLAHLASLLAVVQLLQKNDIDYLAFKGPAFTFDVYGDIALRSYGDLDLLVSRGDLRKAIICLIEAGFSTDIDLSLDQYQKLVARNHHAVLVRGSTVVELHWELSGRYLSGAVEIEKLSGRAECITLNNSSIFTLGSEDLLVYLCIHGCRHYWLQLDSVCCVNELINRKTELNWKLAFDIAKEQGAVKMLVLGLMLANQIFQVNLPGSIVEELRNFPGIQAVAHAINQRLFASNDSVLAHPGYKEEVRYNFAVMDSKLDWLRYSMRPLFNTTHSDWEWIKIPAVLSSAYYVLRPLRLIMKHTGKWFK